MGGRKDILHTWNDDVLTKANTFTFASIHFQHIYEFLDMCHGLYCMLFFHTHRRTHTHRHTDRHTDRDRDTTIGTWRRRLLQRKSFLNVERSVRDLPCMHWPQFARERGNTHSSTCVYTYVCICIYIYINIYIYMAVNSHPIVSEQ